ncbi:sulfatase [Limibacter armeniacum]|uniref:sulfatase family protein n=1 Tax=Limibacter armeniacum TaxID=466084 RepID=UPI002FE67C9A
MKRRYLLGLIVVPLALLLLSFIRNAEKKPMQPNIVWITSEDNSKHYMKLFDENGVSTPHIESLAAHGLIFNRAFSNSPVCSVARSTMISGSYAPRLGTQYHRKLEKVPMPDSHNMFPAYLQKAGYYTTNNSKEDYNFIKGDEVWNESSKKASWKNRKEGQPFFHVSNIGISHEGSMHFSEEEMMQKGTKTHENSFKVQPNHPDTKIFRYTNAYYRDKIVEMDTKVGQIVSELKKDGLLENTFIFYFGDHGGVLPGSKGYLYETGLHVPMVVHIPEKYKHLIDMKAGSTVNGFISFIDLAPTVLNLAGIKVPEGMDGKPFLGKGVSASEVNKRDEVFSYADRFDEKYDLVRAVRKGKYKYIRSYEPFNIDGLMNNYRFNQLAYKEWQLLYEQRKLNNLQSAFFEKRSPEMLFDIEADPFETTNLAKDPTYKKVLKLMREKLDKWQTDMPDLSFFPEFYLMEHAFKNPSLFGQKHKQDILKYKQVADLSLKDFSKVKDKLTSSLLAEDPLERNWALITCCCLGKEAKDLEKLVRTIAINDFEHMNRVRAAEFLAITGLENPEEVMTNTLYQSQKPAEALLILNTIVLMQSKLYGYEFDIEYSKLSQKVQEDIQVKRRLTYLQVI